MFMVHSGYGGLARFARLVGLRPPLFFFNNTSYSPTYALDFCNHSHSHATLRNGVGQVRWRGQALRCNTKGPAFMMYGVVAGWCLLGWDTAEVRRGQALRCNIRFSV